MSKSNFLEDTLLDEVLGGSDYTPPANVYVSLYTTDPGDDDSGTEVSGNAYARVEVTNNATNWPASSGGSKSNGIAITFPQATGSWGTVTHFGIHDASTAGNLLYHGALGTSKEITTDDTAEFAIGDITITED